MTGTGSSPITQSPVAPRLLIITDHTELGRALEQHVSIVWPDAECRIHAPLQSGRLHSGFNAVGYDVVMLDDRIERGQGEKWLDNLLHRNAFPPILYLARGDDPALAARVVKRGAIDCLARDRIDHRRMSDVLRKAMVQRRQQLALARTGPEVERLSQFGPVTIRGHRFVRELAIGGTSSVYLAESERAGEMVVLKVLRDSPSAGDEHTQFARFLQEYELISKVRHPNVVRIFDLGIADDHAYLAMEYFPRGDLRSLIAQRPRRRRSAVVPGADGGGVAGRARGRRAAPRPEAGQHHAARGRLGRADRLRPGEARRTSMRRSPPPARSSARRTT